MIKKIFYRCTDSVWELMFLYLSVLLSSSYLYSYIEGKTLFEGLWWGVVTSMTVGYGDMYPATVHGKILGISLMFIMAFFILPMIIAKMVEVLRQDRDKFSNEEQEEIRKLLIEIKEKC